MEYTTLGETGMKVSRICLGCMTFGSKEWNEWAIEEPASREIIARAIDLGVNFFDTSNTYSRGESERILGAALGEYDRDRFVVSTKGFYQLDPANPNSGGLSRKAIDYQLRRSLERLDMETVDLYQIHRWDYGTPIEETLRALDDAVRRNQTRYVGASAMWAHQFAEALYASDRLGLERFATMQNHYNLTYREEEREMMPLCAKEDVGVIPWSPLARGYLTRPDADIDATTRGREDSSLTERPYREGGGREINERVRTLADEKGVTMAQIGIAWHLHKEWVDAPIIGTSSVEHLEQAVEAVDIDLSRSDIDYLEEPYRPVPVSGHNGSTTPDRFV